MFSGSWGFPRPRTAAAPSPPRVARLRANNPTRPILADRLTSRLAMGNSSSRWDPSRSSRSGSGVASAATHAEPGAASLGGPSWSRGDKKVSGRHGNARHRQESQQDDDGSKRTGNPRRKSGRNLVSSTGVPIIDKLRTPPSLCALYNIPQRSQGFPDRFTPEIRNTIPPDSPVSRNGEKTCSLAAGSIAW